MDSLDQIEGSVKANLNNLFHEDQLWPTNIFERPKIHKSTRRPLFDGISTPFNLNNRANPTAKIRKINFELTLIWEHLPKDLMEF